ncbi:MAG: helix-turn-helix domain-containing protein [Nanohaloarchaea archaeon]|nr:helix-turn-helix domain-containing protein [Candidatus Nanohaloarchaea archaeon]
MADLLKSGKRLEAKDLSPEKLDALKDPTRRKILNLLSEEPSYPAEIAKELDIGKQKTYYHFKKLKNSGIIKQERQEKRSGGIATFYKLSSDAFSIDFSKEGEKRFFPEKPEHIKEFFDPLLNGSNLEGKVVVGSPEEHGPDQVKAADGHLAFEIGRKLGAYTDWKGRKVKLDTEIKRESSFDQNLLILGGILTNTVAKRFNGDFPVEFSEEFPYRGLETPENTYTSGSIGVVAKADNPAELENSIFLVAGVRAEGTEAAVEAFKNLETITEDYRSGEFYRVVEGKDMDGDGKIDSYEVIE